MTHALALDAYADSFRTATAVTAAAVAVLDALDTVRARAGVLASAALAAPSAPEVR
ncbi:hypothetical protein [Streptomyces sp. NBC_00076]|uniref:hypothetical protein n=1 Tax=Streptomyces sp. NBC_00076 TaxID=2975642 RepID=UPI00324A7F41